MTASEGFVAPDYANRSLGDVLPAVAVALGFGPDHGFVTGSAESPRGLVLPAAPAYAVLLVDGMGAELLAEHAETAPYLSSLQEGNLPGTAGVPSTTATSLTSFGTGLTPGAHGLVGFTSRVPGTDTLLNALFWDKSVDPVEWQPHPTAFDRLAAAGATVTVVSKREFRGSGLTVASQRGAEYVGADRAGERIAGAVAASSTEPSLTYLYEGDLDWTGHRYGVDSPQWRQQLAVVDAEAELLREALSPSTRLVVVADHGMVDSPAAHRVDVDAHLELRDGLVLFGGEARFRHLYCQGGAVEDVLATWSSYFGESALVLARDEAIARGWFGSVSSAVLPRLGDVVVASTGDHGIFSSVDFGYETSLIGLHGSLTSAEMLIPILVD